MRRFLAGTTVIALLTAACGAGPGRPAPTPETSTLETSTPETSTPETPACDPALDRAFGAWADAGFSGSVAILRDGAFECRAAYGMADAGAHRPNTPGTVFSLGSVTKAVTAAAILRLAAAGRLSLGDRVGEVAWIRRTWHAAVKDGGRRRLTSSFVEVRY